MSAAKRNLFHQHPTPLPRGQLSEEQHRALTDAEVARAKRLEQSRSVAARFRSQ